MESKAELRKKATILKLALRTQGVNVLDKVPDVGTKIKEDILGLYKIDDVKILKPNEIVIYENITTKLVHNPSSPFKLFKNNDDFYIGVGKKRKPLFKIGFSKRPKHYSLHTSRGTPMKHVAQVMGADCLAIAVNKRCHYFTNGDFCKFCNITPTNVESKIDRISDFRDLVETIKAAGKYYKFFDLTGGTFADRDEECEHYIKIGNIIKDTLGRQNYSGPFSLSPPKNLNLLEKLHETGVDVISFNPDVWDDEVFRKICPGKAKIGKDHYDKALQKAKELWGSGNSVVQFLVGPWESGKSLLEGVQYHLNRGILVNLTTFFPSPKSTLRYSHPKDLREILDIYVKYGKLVRESELYPNNRGSILTSVSANRSSISNEVAKGYLTEDNYDPNKDLDFLQGEVK